MGHGVNHIMVSTMCVYGSAFRLQLVQRSEEVRLSVEYGCPEPTCQIHEGKRCDSKLPRLSYSESTAHIRVYVLGKGEFGFRRGKGTRVAVGMLRIISERILDLD